MYIYLLKRDLWIVFERKITDKRKYLASKFSNEFSFDILVHKSITCVFNRSSFWSVQLPF